MLASSLLKYLPLLLEAYLFARRILLKSLVLSLFTLFIAPSVFAQSSRELYEMQTKEITRRQYAVNDRVEEASARIRELQLIELSQKALQKLAGEKQVIVPMEYAEVEWDASRDRKSNQARNQITAEKFGYGYNKNKDLCEVNLKQSVFVQNSTVKVNAVAICVINGKEVVFQASSGVEPDVKNNFGYSETFVEAMSNYIESHPFKDLLSNQIY